MIIVICLSSVMQIINESSLVLSILEEQRLVVCYPGINRVVVQVYSDSVTKVYCSSFTLACCSEMALSDPLHYFCVAPGHS